MYILKAPKGNWQNTMSREATGTGVIWIFLERLQVRFVTHDRLNIGFKQTGEKSKTLSLNVI